MKNIKCISLYLILSLVILLVFQLLSRMTNPFHGAIWGVTERARPKLILVWEPNFAKEPYGLRMGTRTFVDAGCSILNCETTTDRSRFHEVDAVWFHMRHLYNSRGFKNGSIVEGYDMPTTKPLHQRWVYYMQESPIYTNPPMHLFSNIFNWTMTYKKGSDFWVPHGISVLKTDSERLKSRQTEINYAAKKTKLVAWFVSHCHPHSQRENYVVRLRRYIKVDIYGFCGRLKCPKTIQYGSDACYEMLTRDYKFYLAFENAICRDYASCKYWTMLQNSTAVPVVRGGADYDTDGPPKSFIDANALTPKELAQKLKTIAANDALYNSYHAWRKDYHVYGSWSWNVGQGFCQMCAALNDESLPRKTYPDLGKF